MPNRVNFLNIAGGVLLVVAAIVLRVAPADAWQTSLGTPSQIDQDMRDRQIKALNQQRQQDIRKDTDKLYQLATELKAAVDKSNENVLSLEVVKKAGEVEKLAKRVKEKMKESVGPNPRTEPVPRMPYPGPPR